MTTLPDRWPPGAGDRPPAEEDPPGPLWADGGFLLRVANPAGGPAREVRVDRPFGLIGRLAGADVQIEDRAVSGRHLYLHLDARGLFAVDLATRTGTRFEGRERPSGWLRPGQGLEVAGHRIELLECRLRGADRDRDQASDSAEGGPTGPPGDLLADAGGAPLARVTLFPSGPGGGHARTLGSELVFLGRGACCGVRIEAASASRTHCVLARTRGAAYVVDLIGRGTWINGRAIRGAALLPDGAVLTIGSASFEARVRPHGQPGDTLAVRASSRAELLPHEAPPGPPAFPPLPPDAQGALLAWMMGQLHAQQGEAMRRQAEFQRDLTSLVRQMQEDQATLLSEHLERTEAIQRELASLRQELDRRLAPHPPASPTELPRPKAQPLQIDPTPRPAGDPDIATSWLIGRINQLEEESRSSWKNILGRFTGARGE